MFRNLDLSLNSQTDRPKTETEDQIKVLIDDSHTSCRCMCELVYELLVGNSDINEQYQKLKLHAAVWVAANAKLLMNITA